MITQKWILFVGYQPKVESCSWDMMANMGETMTLDRHPSLQRCFFVGFDASPKKWIVERIHLNKHTLTEHVLILVPIGWFFWN